MLPNPQPFFSDLRDPRRETRNRPHKLEDIVMIMLCAVLGGYEDWVNIEELDAPMKRGCEDFLNCLMAFRHMPPLCQTSCCDLPK